MLAHIKTQILVTEMLTAVLSNKRVLLFKYIYFLKVKKVNDKLL